jgi:hypothetical protein
MLAESPGEFHLATLTFRSENLESEAIVTPDIPRRRVGSCVISSDRRWVSPRSVGRIHHHDGPNGTAKAEQHGFSLLKIVQPALGTPAVDQRQRPRVELQKPHQLRWRATQGRGRLLWIGMADGQDVEDLGQ